MESKLGKVLQKERICAIGRHTSLLAKTEGGKPEVHG